MKSRRRKRSSRRGKEKRETSTTRKAQLSTVEAEAVAGREVPDHELTVLGFANIARRFDIDERNNGPNVVYHLSSPMSSFIEGYSDGTVSDQDPEAATLTSATGTDTLYPITPLAEYFESDCWPLLSSLFASGTGSREKPTINEFVRYNAMLLKALCYVQSVLTINRLTFHFDWTKVFPFTDVVPTHLYQMATNFKATDVDLAETWLPIMKRFDGKIAFPRMVAEIKRMLTPMLSVDLNGRLHVPLYANCHPATGSGATFAAAVIALLDYIDGVNLADAAATIATFLPFPIQEMVPWYTPDQPVIDIDRETGRWNSGVKNFDTFGDTDDPQTTETLRTFLDSGGDYSTFEPHTRHTQITWAELRLASVFKVEYHAVDNTFRLISPHKYGNTILVDDSFDYFEYDGTAISTGSDGFRYIDFVDSRFASADVNAGVLRPGIQGAEVTWAPYNRLMRLETTYLSNAEVIKLVMSQAAGASLRELRYSIANLVYSGLQAGR